ncbi:hypothetical protein BJV82DRAFT_590986 [Fennellomyces sp. T-0311]|nr:hypothetical protein BJV82DRAFT_590986 [Fennellomyces sp. T-0311]
MAHQTVDDVMKPVLSKRKRGTGDIQDGVGYTEEKGEPCDSDTSGSVYHESEAYLDCQTDSDEDKKYQDGQGGKTNTGRAGKRRLNPLTWGHQPPAVINTESKEELIDMVINRGLSVVYATQELKINRQLGYEIMNEHMEMNGLTRPGKSRQQSTNSTPSLKIVHTLYLQDLIDSDHRNTIEMIRGKLERDFPELKPLSISHVERHLSKKIAFTLSPLERPEIWKGTQSATEQRRAFVTKLHRSGVDYRKNCMYLGDLAFVLMMVSGKTRSTKYKPQYVVSQVQYKRLFTMYAAVSSTGELSKFSVKIGQFSSSVMVDIVQQIFAQNPEIIIFTTERIASGIRDMLSLNSRNQLVALPSLLLVLDPVDAFYADFRNFLSREPLTEGEALTDRMTAAAQSITSDGCEAWYAQIGEYLAR